MRTRLVFACLVVILVGTATRGGPPAWAQNNRFTDRAFLSSPVVLGMGDAGVALAGTEQALFYNPAHLPHRPSSFTVIGLQAGASRSLPDQIQFLNDRLQPAVREGTNRAGPSRAALEQDAHRLRRRPGRGEGGLTLPAFVYAPGALGIGGGIVAKTAVNYRVDAPDGRPPSLWTLSRTDFMAVLSMGLDLRVLGLSGLSVGVTGTQTRRFLAFKNKRLRDVRPREPAVVLEGGTFQLDGGVSYRVDSALPLPGTLRLGGAVYDLLRAGYGYDPGGPARLPFLNRVVDPGGTGSDAAPAAERRAARQRFALRPSYRIGAAYSVPHLFFLEAVDVAVDYQAYEDGALPLGSRLHLGAEARVVGPLTVRAGLGAGYPSAGMGLELGALHVDYALHGLENRRRFRGQPTYMHTARLLVRLD